MIGAIISIITIAIIIIIAFVYLFKHAKTSRDRGYTVFGLIGTLMAFGIFIFLIGSTYGLFGFGQKKALMDAKIEIPDNVATSSALVFLNEVEPKTTLQDVEEKYGTDYVETSIAMRRNYNNNSLKLNGMRSTDLAFQFFGKRKSNKLDYVQVNFKGKDNEDYEKACEYLIENGLGEPIARTEKEIRWIGWELSITDYGILFIRRFA